MTTTNERVTERSDQPRCSDCTCCTAEIVMGVCTDCQQPDSYCPDCPDLIDPIEPA